MSKKAVISRLGWILLAVISPLYMVSMFYRTVPATIALDLSRDFGVSVPEIAAISSAVCMAGGIMQLPSGIFTDLFGSKKALLFFSFLSVAGAIWFSFSPTLGSAVAASFLCGLGLSVIVPSYALFAHYLPSDAYAQVVGIFIGLGVGGTIMATSPLMHLCALVGWRGVFLISGTLTALSALLAFFILPADTIGKRNDGHAFMEFVIRLKKLRVGMRTVLTSRGFWPVCITFGCAFGVYTCLVTFWWVPYLIQGCGMTQSAAGHLFCLITFPALVTNPLISAISDKTGYRKWIVVPFQVVIVVMLAIMALFPRQMSPAVLLLVSFCFIFGLSWTGIGMAILRDVFPPSVVGTAFGCVVTLPSVLAAPLQAGFGMILQHFSGPAITAEAYTPAMLMLAGVAAVGLVSSFFLKGR